MIESLDGFKMSQNESELSYFGKKSFNHSNQCFVAIHEQLSINDLYSQMMIIDTRNHIDFHQAISGQFFNRIADPGWILPLTKIPSIDLINFIKMLHIDQQDGGFGHMIEGTPCELKGGFEIVHDLVGL